MSERRNNDADGLPLLFSVKLDDSRVVELSPIVQARTLTAVFSKLFEFFHGIPNRDSSLSLALDDVYSPSHPPPMESHFRASLQPSI